MSRKITKEIYELFCKHGCELLWVEDPLRHKRPSGTTPDTDTMFATLEKVDELLALINNKKYSSHLKKEYESELKRLKPKLTSDVFEIILNKHVE